MDEYIGREAVFSEIQFQRELAESDGEASVVDTCDAMLHNLRGLEAADVQLVKHGRWIKSATQKHVEVTYECSECQHEVVGEYEKTPFCGGCGVRMDGVKDNNMRNLTDEETANYESWIESEAKDTGVNIMDGDK